MPEQYGKIVSFRTPKGKELVYPEFFKLVKDTQGGDTCHVVFSFMEAYLQAMKQAPDPNKLIELKFPKQTVIINMGCNFNYSPSRARRLPKQTFPEINLNKNSFLPLFLEEFPTMKEASFQHYQKQFREAGLDLKPLRPKPTHPSVSTRTRKTRVKKTFKWSS
jgi:hypothetical protein